MSYELSDLPVSVRDELLKSYVVADSEVYRSERDVATGNSEPDLFALAMGADNSSVNTDYLVKPVFWATDNYSDRGDGYGFLDPITDVSVIVPRVEKSKAEQKRRVKEKAEVFTPSWVCNVQNNMYDDVLLGVGSFNMQTEEDRAWEPSDKIPFNDETTWLKYVLSLRIEMTCGEAPYLVSRYDAATGDIIPVRDENGKFRRIGVLDRKLRAIAENVDASEWFDYALLALASTFGFEWQGDNLLLARLNLLNTMNDYSLDITGEALSEDDLLLIASTISWNIWQMDGLKMVQPISCSDKCQACKKRLRVGHDGVLPMIRQLHSADKPFILHTFEDLYLQKSK